MAAHRHDRRPVPGRIAGRAVIAAAIILGVGAAGCGSADRAAAPAEPATAAARDRGPVLLSGPAERIDGTVDRLERYRGRVVLVVNTASRCGYTPQFASLQAVYAEHRDRGFVILGFPSGDFGQELAGNTAVAEFCRGNFGVDFPMFARARVTGDHAIPLFRRLAARSRAPGWNFQKYLLDRRGRLAAVYDPATEPDAPAIRRELARLLAEPAPARTAPAT